MMRKINIYSIIVVLLIAFSPVHLRASEETNPTTTATADAARATILINRLEEIKKMDMTTLSRSEKKELRNEVRETKKELKAQGKGGVYLSVGVLILVIVLLILLL